MGPIWAEVYEAFPPKYEPRWDATDSEMPVRKILYREDRVRAQYSKVFGEHEKIDLFSDSKPGSERFVEKFLAIHDSRGCPRSGVGKNHSGPRAGRCAARQAGGGFELGKGF